MKFIIASYNCAKNPGERPACADESDSERRRPVAVDWHDCSWSPEITVISQNRTNRRRLTKRLPATPLVLHTSRRNPIYFKPMKAILPSSRRRLAGFTLVELLVVIAIIAILAAMLLPVLSAVKTNAKKNKAKVEEQGIVTAIEGYDSLYGRFPVSNGTQTSAGTGDFTYGGSILANNGFSSINTSNNSEVIAILTDTQTYPAGGAQTADYNHVKNPQQRPFLNATMVSDPTLPGIGPDLVYRDPWGNPYVISMDLNYDNFCADAFYSSQTVSQSQPNSQTGYYGLVNTTDANGNGNHFQYRGSVMVWSAGPDGKIDPNIAANTGANKDNVLSWQ